MPSLQVRFTNRKRETILEAKKYLLVLTIIVVALLAFNGLGQSARTSRKTWEYKVLNTWQISEKDLNRLGSEGWEFVKFDSGARAGNPNVTPHYLFKREK
ncbi:MAG: hypothetical protein AB7H86_01250 [Blastocatellales bacterium]